MLTSWLIFALLFRLPAFAAELPAGIPLGKDATPNQVAIPMYTAGQCEARLRPIVDPAAVIGQGLTALKEVNAGSTNNSCLNDIVKLWDELVPELKPNPGEVVSRTEANDPELLAADRRIEALNEDLNCSLPAPGPGVDYEMIKAVRQQRCGKELAFDPARKEKEEERLKLIERRGILRAELQIKQGLAMRLASTWILDPEPSAVESLIGPHMQCHYWPSKPGCASLPKLSPEEFNKKREAAEGLLKSVRDKITEQRRALIELVHAPEESAAYFDIAKLEALDKKRVCAQSAMYDYDSYCKSIGLYPPGDLTQIEKEIRAGLKNPEELAEDLIRRKPELEISRLAVNRAKARDYEEKYGLRRLLALYHAFSLKHPAGDKVTAFCRTNEAEQSRDLRFAKMMGGVAPLSSAEQWRWASEHGATEGDLNAIAQYTGSYYDKINRAIWAANDRTNPKPVPEADQTFKASLDAALDKAEPYRESKVIRFAHLPKAILAQHKVGAIVTYDAYTSTSKDANWQWNEESDGNAANRFVIYPGKNGVLIESVSFSKAEEEVLFKAGTRFKVLSRKPRAQVPGTFDFVLAEVDEHGTVIGKGK